MAKGDVIASKEVSFVIRDGFSIQMVELKSCDQACPRIEIYQAAEGAVAAYQRDVYTHPFDGGDIEGLGKQVGNKFQGPCEHTEYCGSSDATLNRACFIK